MKKKYVVVGFRVDTENSIWYRKFDRKIDLLRFLNERIDEVDFVSLRIVKKGGDESGRLL